MDALYKGLDVSFNLKLAALTKRCFDRNVELQIVEGVRNPFLQAQYWRRSRSEDEVNQQIDYLRAEKAFFLAYCIQVIGPQNGPFATNALPGFSWHQWGEAADFVWIVNGKRQWDSNFEIGGIKGYQVYADEARKLNLDAGYYWTSFQDSCHVQLRSTPSPQDLFNLTEIDEEMQSRFEYLLLTD